jgi:Nucleotide modification associated domain 3
MARQMNEREARKALLLRVGIDRGTGGGLGPIFPDGTFEYVPIPERKRTRITAATRRCWVAMACRWPIICRASSPRLILTSILISGLRPTGMRHPANAGSSTS